MVVKTNWEKAALALFINEIYRKKVMHTLLSLFKEINNLKKTNYQGNYFF